MPIWQARRGAAALMPSSLSKIRAVHDESNGRYGAPRVHAELRRRGRRHSRKRVARLMREAGIARTGAQAVAQDHHR